MFAPVTFTLDLEDLRSSPSQEMRVDAIAPKVFDFLAQQGVRGSVYVVGDIARDHPGLVKRIADDGHEIGLHAMHHRPLASWAPEQFRADTADAQHLLEDLSGMQVTGFRAPMMSLVPASAWTIPILTELGFVYSSSVLPAPSPLYGWPGLPRVPFRWLSGLIELPCPLVSVGPLQAPFLGGAYLRLMPKAMLRHGLTSSPAEAVLWSYCHPWEFDADEAFYVFDDGGWVASRIGWLNRKNMMKRVNRVLTTAPHGAPLGVHAARLASDESLVVVDPESFTTIEPKRRRLNGLLRTE